MKFQRSLRIFLLLLLAFSVSVSISCSKKEAADDEETSESDEESENDSEAEEEDNSEDSNSHEDGEDHDSDSNKNANDEKSADDDKKSSAKNDHSEEAKVSEAEFAKIWDDLMAGNKRFMAGSHTTKGLAESRKSLTGGQKPGVVVVSCSDSRVPPELVFDKNLGELFVIRTAGNVLDPIALGSVEYAAAHLGPKMIVVLGHESCGAVAATLSGDKMPTSNLNAIVSSIRPSFKGERECDPGSKGGDKCVKLNVTNSARSFVSRSPILKDKVAKGSLQIVHAIYSMESGKVDRF